MPRVLRGGVLSYERGTPVPHRSVADENRPASQLTTSFLSIIEKMAGVRIIFQLLLKLPAKIATLLAKETDW